MTYMDLLAAGRSPVGHSRPPPFGTAKEKAGVLSFVVDGIHAHDIGTILDMEGVAVRAGHHCAMPVMKRFGVPATARASVAFYNTRADLDALAKAIHKAIEVFA
jgi:cysteine desulfurase/selenocysteine lyase